MIPKSTAFNLCFLMLPLLLLAAGSLPASAQEKLFPPDAVIDVSRPPYNARPDDNLDDTAAIQQAITDHVGTAHVLYFPNGTYNLSAPLQAKGKNGHWLPCLTLQGQSRDKVILRLADHAPGFADPGHPQAIITTGSQWEKGDAADGGGNKAYRNNIFDLTINTGKTNPGAIGIAYAVSNLGAIKNVSLSSEDGQGVSGISLTRGIPGPGLLQNILVRGFAVGIDVGDIQYGITMEDITLQGQHLAGIRNGQNVLHIYHLQSDNRVPALLVTRLEGVVTLLDAQLRGVAPDQRAIISDGSLMLRNLTTEGYQPDALCFRGAPAAGGNLASWIQPATGTPPQPVAPLLPIEKTPTYWNNNLADWTAVGPRLAGEKDDTLAIQRALDSGRKVIYLPNNRVYFISDTLIIRGAVRQVLGLGSEISLGAAKDPFSDPAHPKPLIRIDPTAGPELFLENLFFNAQYPGEVIFENNSPQTLVIKQCGGWVGTHGLRRSYRNTPQANGKLFLEDVYLPGWEFSRQTIWARQFNPENNDGDGSTPLVAATASQLWILGFKTEGPAPYLVASAGSKVELLGAYNYISATDSPKVPEKSIPYLITNSQAQLSFTTDNFRDSSDYLVYIRQIQNGQVRDWKASDLLPRNGRPGSRSFVVPLWQNTPASTHP